MVYQNYDQMRPQNGQGNESPRPLSYDDKHKSGTNDTSLFSEPYSAHPKEHEEQHHHISNRRDRKALLRSWGWELFVLLVAIGTIITIAALLQRYHGQEQPSWKYSLNLNTLIAILSTLLRSSLVEIVESVTSQLKWMWFRQPQPVQHLDAFDGASRGPWGATLMPFRVRQWNVAVIGCIVTVLSLAIGSFTQQAVQTYACERPTTGIVSSLPIAKIYPRESKTGRRTSPGSYDMDQDIKAILFNGIASPSSNPRLTLDTKCPTGNCTFPEFNGITHSTTGLCHKCLNITSLITDSGTNLTMPNGMVLNDPFSYLNVSTGPSLSSTFGQQILQANPDFAAILSNSLVNTTFMGFTTDRCTVYNTTVMGVPATNITCPRSDLNLAAKWDTVNVFAATCALYPCVKDYRGSVTNGVLNEVVVNESPLVEAVEDSPSILNNHTAFHTPCVVGGKPYSLSNISSIPKELQNFRTELVGTTNITGPQECFYMAQGIPLRAMQEVLMDWFQGTCAMPLTSYVTISGIRPESFESATCDGWWLKNLISSGVANVSSIDKSLSGFTDAATVAMRRQGVDWSFTNASVVTGSVSHTAVCTQFNWPWLLLPIILLLLTIISLLIMLIKTWSDRQQIPIWRSSILPTLFIGSSVVAHHNGGPNNGHRHAIARAPTDIEAIKKEAEKVVVSLRHTGSGWEFAREGRGLDGGNREFEMDGRKGTGGSSDDVSLLSRRGVQGLGPVSPRAGRFREDV